MSRLRPVAALALLGLAVAGCSGPLTVSGPGVLVSSEPAPPSGVQLDGLRIEKGMNASLTVTSSEPEVAEAVESGVESGVDQLEDRRIHAPEAAGSNPAPATPAPSPGLLDLLEAVRAENDPWREFALAIMDRLLEQPDAFEPSKSPPERPRDALEPVAGDVRDIIEDREGRSAEPYADIYGQLHVGVGHQLSNAEIDALYSDDLTKAEAEAERVLQGRYGELDPWRQNAWVVLCFSAACAGFEDAIEATLAGDWETAAAELLDSVFAREERHREYANMLARWLRTGHNEP